ncbi:MAG: MazG family protein [Acidimicrobiales bacterium]
MTSRPKVVVAGLGPAGPDLVPPATQRAVRGAVKMFVRTLRHPAAAELPIGSESFDGLYEKASSFEEVYSTIVEVLVDAARAARSEGGYVAYVVPGSPFVAERSVVLLSADPRVDVEILPALSFADLVWARLAVDPLSSSVRFVDGTDFAVQASGERGPLLVGQCHSRAVLSEIKLAVDTPPDRDVVLLHHLGLEDEVVRSVPWSELDRSIDPDHLTALWIPELAAPVASELVQLQELVRTLREKCPWDRAQTHGSLARHLLEEAYEALDAIEVFAAAEPDVPIEAVSHLEEELGDVLFQVVLHCALAAEGGRFTLADVARTVHDKLVRRHPHVFGDVHVDTADEVAERWELLKKAEKGRRSVTEGIPAALPALALAAKLQRKAESLHMELPDATARADEIRGALALLATAAGTGSGEILDAESHVSEEVGELLFAAADLARRVGVDPETALRAYAQRFRSHVESTE